MDLFAKETIPISLEEEMRKSYIEYAMSVIVGRALPDVRDGLKPVHRRVLFSMHEMNNVWNRPYVKCARVVGETMGKYHPHGDASIYDTLVRMAQPFSLRYMLVDGQGNFGSVDGDGAAAMRYTECRLEETVDFVPNYDGKEKEPSVLPTRIPNLLINGSSGIAVGMATNIPPHNITEVIDGALHVLHNPDATVDELIERIPAPDFPTGGIIYGISGVRDGYRTGRGRVVMRAKTHFEEFGKEHRTAIIVDELPYQVNKKSLLERIAELVREKKLEGISDIRDESDKSGMRVVIELKRGEVAEVVLNNLYKQTQLQDTFGMNMVALVDGQPKLLNLKQLLESFLSHRREVVTRRTVFELRKARERGHLLEGLAVALANIDDFIAIIKAAPTPPVAKGELMARAWDSSMVTEDLITPQDMVVTLSHTGYMKSQPVSEYRAQKRGGRGKQAMATKDDDWIDQIFIANTHDYILCFSNRGRLYWLKVWEVPQGSRNSRGRPIVNMFPLQDGEKITVVLPLSGENRTFPEDHYIFMATSLGTVKKTPLSDFSNPRKAGIIAVDLDEGDFLIGAALTDGEHDVMLFSDSGKAVRFDENDVRPMGRTARGVRGMSLEEGQQVIALLVAENEQQSVLTATENGYGKRTPITEYTRHGRGTKGMIAIQTSERNGKVVAATLVDVNDEILLITTGGVLIRTRVAEIREMGRATQGVTLIAVEDGTHLSGLQRIVESDVAELDEDSPEAPDAPVAEQE
jgi:DNA gyrase subunit A